jgi:hypothetical protein
VTIVSASPLLLLSPPFFSELFSAVAVAVACGVASVAADCSFCYHNFIFPSNYGLETEKTSLLTALGRNGEGGEIYHQPN